jgi:hypothetical protein
MKVSSNKESYKAFYVDEALTFSVLTGGHLLLTGAFARVYLVAGTSNCYSPTADSLQKRTTKLEQ